MNFHGCVWLFWIAAVGVTGAFAYPRNPMPMVVDNQGDSLTVRNLGDEHYSRTQTSDGYLVIRDTLGVYYYADENGDATNIKAKDEAGRTEKEKKFLKSLNRNKSLENHRKKHPDRLKRPSEEKPKPAPWANPQKLSSNVPAVLRLPKAEGYGNGTNRFPVVLVSNSSTTNVDSAALSSLLNKKGYSGSYPGSIRDYFLEQSTGKFDPTFDMYNVTVSNTFASYKDREYYLVTDVIAALMSKYPNFNAAIYDADNDGEVDSFGILYAGTEAASNNMGGFQYAMEYQRQGGMVSAGNGKVFNRYYIFSQQDNLYPVFIHEFSHTMGLVDHYCVYSDGCYSDFSSSQYQAPGAHAWDVMATGMYNGNHRNPPAYSAFERNFMGWMDYETLDANADIISLEPLPSSNKAYKIPVPGTKDEWFIIENRQQSNKWDAKLPYHGLLIWHIDYNWNAWNSDAMNDNESHQRVDVVEAGNLKVTSYYDGFKSNHLVDDPYPGSQKVTSFYGFKSWSGEDLGVKLYNIMEQNGRVCFSLKQGVQVTSCEAPESSSSVASSSSSAKQSSSSSAVLSSSSNISPWIGRSSSSATSAILQPVFGNSVQLSVRGNILEVFTTTTGAKRLELFDMLGNKLLSKDFRGEKYDIDFRPFAGKVLVVRVTQNGRLLKQSRVSVK